MEFGKNQHEIQKKNQNVFRKQYQVHV